MDIFQNSMGSIKTTLKAYNYAPLKNFKGELSSESLSFAIYADNGEGKTFLSKAFRLTESKEMPLSDKYISFGETTGNFSFCVTTGGKEVENFEIKFTEGAPASCSYPQRYIFHTFNQEFIDENIRSVSFDKKRDHIDGYIIGKAKIDLREDEEKLEALKKESEKKNIEIQSAIDESISAINGIYNIKRIQEYSLLSNDYIFHNYDKPLANIDKSLEEYIREYDLIKSIPENIELLKETQLPVLDKEWLALIFKDLQTSFSVSFIATEFKEKIKGKQLFVEEGTKLFLADPNKCPYCEQEISTDASRIINLYIDYFNQEEAKHIKRFKSHIQGLDILKTNLEKTRTANLAEKSKAAEYIIKYLPSAAEKTFEELELSILFKCINDIKGLLEKKVSNISESFSIGEDLINIEKEYITQQIILNRNNFCALSINKILNDSAEANRNIRRNICRALFNEIVNKIGPEISLCVKLTEARNSMIDSINEKRKAEIVKRQDKVSETIKKVLNAFFRGKYTFDDSSFLLQCKGTSLLAGQASHVLSEGEKSIIAFAYYLGDVFVKVEEEEDYSKLFFIIDDPISSMDFNYVYVLSTIIRELKSFIPITSHIRILLLTHNLEFMRIIVGNRIISNCYSIKNNQLKKFNNNFTVPYISHLNDIFSISTGKTVITHTTANSIRHILESVMKFEDPCQSPSLEEYVRQNLPDDKYTYTLIQDLSHGATRPDIMPIKEEDYIKVCEYVIDFLRTKYPAQIEYCKTLT